MIRGCGRLVSLGFLLVASSCTWTQTPASNILVIAIEDLGFGAVSCESRGEGERASGFEILCHEAVRFTHAYTTSNLSQPALASLLTARYAHDHGVRDNGGSFLPAKIETVTEVAAAAGRRTAFFGGGPPIWRNSGLNQGFEFFDDNITPSATSLYRPANEVIRLFMDWRSTESIRRPFFAVLHLADPPFVDAPTATDLGEVRTNSYRSQVEEVDETLGTLFRQLRALKIWDSTTVVVTGLAGHVSESRFGEAFETNLYSERTRIALFIKPARKAHEGAFNWKVDANVSLCDVGATLYDLLSHAVPESWPPVTSLHSILEGPEPSWSEDRLIVTESSWAEWRGLSGRRFALRQGPFLFLHDGSGRLFNTLTDSLETASLRADDLRYRELRAPFDEFVTLQGFAPWRRLEAPLVEKLNLSRELWSHRRPTGDLLRRLRLLARQRPEDFQLQGWRALFALREARWNELRDAGLRAANSLWGYVASKNLGEKGATTDDPCLRLFDQLDRGHQPTLRECPSREILELFGWADQSQTPLRRQQAMERFFRFYGEIVLDDKIAAVNRSLGLRWDLPIGLPSGPRLTDLALSLPELRRYQSQVERRALGENK